MVNIPEMPLRMRAIYDYFLTKKEAANIETHVVLYLGETKIFISFVTKNNVIKPGMTIFSTEGSFLTYHQGESIQGQGDDPNIYTAINTLTPTLLERLLEEKEVYCEANPPERDVITQKNLFISPSPSPKKRKNRPPMTLFSFINGLLDIRSQYQDLYRLFGDESYKRKSNRIYNYLKTLERKK